MKELLVKFDYLLGELPSKNQITENHLTGEAGEEKKV